MTIFPAARNPACLAPGPNSFRRPPTVAAERFLPNSTPVLTAPLRPAPNVSKNPSDAVMSPIVLNPDSAVLPIAISS